MASVQQVYKTLKDLANKDQRGFVTPSVFNTFAPVAQSKIFNDLFQELTIANNLKLRGLDLQRHLGKVKQIEEDLSTFSKTSTVSISSTGSFAKPDDLAKIISLRVSGIRAFGTSTSNPIDVMYDEEKLEYVLHSNLSAPTEESPIAFLDDQIEVYPQSLNKIRVRYYKQPEGLSAQTGARTASLPKFGFTVANNKETYNAATSVDFELPEHYVPQIVEEMARLIGVNLRDANIYNYGQQQAQQK